MKCECHQLYLIGTIFNKLNILKLQQFIIYLINILTCINATFHLYRNECLSNIINILTLKVILIIFLIPHYNCLSNRLHLM